jgi:hypothetical protein
LGTANGSAPWEGPGKAGTEHETPEAGLGLPLPVRAAPVLLAQVPSAGVGNKRNKEYSNHCPAPRAASASVRKQELTEQPCWAEPGGN